MPAPNVAESLPPESDQPFNIGEADDSLPRMCALFEQLGDTYRVYSPLRKASVWVINHPDDVKRVLVSNHRNYTKGLGFDRVRILLGTGLIASEGEFWRRQRYLMQPSFHRRVLTRFAEVIGAANERRLARWQSLADAGELVNVTDETSEMTLEIVLETIFGTDLARITAEFGANPFAIVTQEPARDLKFAYRFRSLGKVIAAMLAHRRANPGEHFDYLAMLQDARDKDTGDAMSDRELIDEVLTLIVAGHETTASALNSMWYLLARNPDAERKLHRELDAAPEWLRASLTEIESLGYAHSVCDESMRMYPPGWLLSRRAIEADVLGGYDIAGRHRRFALALCAASTSAVLALAGEFSAGALRRRARTGATALCVHAIRCRPATLHRRSAGDVRNAGAPLQVCAALPASAHDAGRHRIRGAGQPAYPASADDAAGVAQPHEPGSYDLMTQPTTLRTARRERRSKRAITISRARTSAVSWSTLQLHERAHGLLHHLQAGRKAWRPPRPVPAEQ